MDGKVGAGAGDPMCAILNSRDCAQVGVGHDSQSGKHGNQGDQDNANGTLSRSGVKSLTLLP